MVARFVLLLVLWFEFFFPHKVGDWAEVRLCFCWADTQIRKHTNLVAKLFLFVTVLFRICFVGKGQKGVFFEQIHR